MMSIPKKLYLKTDSLNFGKYQNSSIVFFFAVIYVCGLAFPIRIWMPIGPFGSFTPLDILMLLSPLILLIVESADDSSFIRFGRNQIALALAVPIFIGFISLLWSVNTKAAIIDDSAALEALLSYFIVVSIFSRLSVRGVGNVMAILTIVLVATALLSIVGVPGFQPQIPSGLSHSDKSAYLVSYYSRLSHPYLGLSNNLATVLVMFPILLETAYEITGRRVYRFGALVGVAGILGTLSRGVAIALVSGYVLWIHKNFKKNPSSVIRRMLLFVALFFVTATVLMLDAHIKSELHTRFTSTSITQRLDAQRDALAAIAESPLIGYGAGVALSSIGPATQKNSHNGYLQQLFYYGVPLGLVVCLALLALPLSSWRWPLHTKPGRMAKSGLALSIGMYLITILFEASFEGTLLRVYFYASIGLGVAMVIAAEEGRV